MRFRFTIRDLLCLTTIVAIVLAFRHEIAVVKGSTFCCVSVAAIILVNLIWDCAARQRATAGQIVGK
jgi:hypothetical protein